MTSAAVRIDPRLRARRIEVRRAEGRRRLRFVVGGAVVAMLAAGTWAATRSALLDLDHVRIEGVDATSAAKINGAVQTPDGTPLLDLDLATIEAEVASLPWVETVNASREWPGTLRLDVVERVAVAALPAGDGSFVAVDTTGVAMAALAGADVGSLPVIGVAAEGELGTVQERSAPALAVVEVMPADLDAWIETITVSGADPDTRLGLNLVGGAVVELGNESLLTDKLDAVRAVLAGADLRCIEVIDVRVADLSTITRDPTCDAALSGGEADEVEAAG